MLAEWVTIAEFSRQTGIRIDEANKKRRRKPKLDSATDGTFKRDSDSQALCEEHWKEWSGNYIDGHHEIVD